jgi:superfamily II DNA or RNA helicase
MNNILTKQGYVINKKLNRDKLNEVIQELTVSPQNNFNKNIIPESFKVYIENDESLIIPKFYGIKKFGLPVQNCENEGLQVDLKFNGKLKEKQIDIMNKTMPEFNKNNGGLLCLGCGEGKCLGYNTDIILYNGKIKKVQDINVGDKLMGDNLSPRNVLSITTGFEKMYNIKDLISGEKYIVNSSHILSLKYISTLPTIINDKKYTNGDIIDITITEYLTNLNNMKEFYGYRLPILTFKEKHVDIDPFEIGKNIDKHQFIPEEYKFNSYSNREKLGKGICVSKIVKSINNKHFIIKANNIRLIKDIIYLFRSLGHNVYKIDDFTINIETYVNLNNLDYLAYKIHVKERGVESYYGFVIDNNKRFMLGDFTITHNTVLSLYISSLFKVKTLVIVHKSFLLNQWKSRAEEFTNANVGILQQNNIDVENKQIVIGMLQSIAKNKYDPDIFKEFGLVIFDEAHHAPSKYFSKALPIINCKRTLALSATPNRSDKLEKVLFWYFGDILYKQPTETLNNVLVKMIKYDSKDKNFKEFRTNYGKDINRPKTINKLTELVSRNKLIIKIIKEILEEPERKLLILSDRIEHLNTLHASINALEITTCSYYIGGMKQKKLDESTKAQVIFATYSMAQEALDIPELNTLLMVTPRKEIEQAIGRITRKKDHPVQPLVIDIIDQLPSFDRQSKHRKIFYNKKQFMMKLFEAEEDKIVNELNLEKVKEYKKEDIIVEELDFID